MDDEQKKVYRKRSDMHVHLVEFLERIEDQVTAQEISEDASIDFQASRVKKKPRWWKMMMTRRSNSLNLKKVRKRRA